MKKILYTAAAITMISFASCSKKESGNKNVISADTENVAENANEETLRYVADDGSSALVTFKNDEDDKSISVRSNNKTISAPLKGDSVYINYDFTIVAKNDSVTITQGDNVIKLKKARVSK